MPLANVQLIEGVFSKEEKTQLMEKISQAFIDIKGERIREFILVIIQEVKSGDWAVAGKPVLFKAA